MAHNSVLVDGQGHQYHHGEEGTNASQGHVIYQVTFRSDNITLLYDFNTELFFTASDENSNHHIAKNVVYFQNKYYFVSLIDGGFYEFGSNFTNYQYASDDIKEIPRRRILPSFKLPTQDRFVVVSVSFRVEMGQPNQITVLRNDPLPTNLITTEGGDLITTEGGDDLVTEGGSEFNEIRNMAIDLSMSFNGAQSFGSPQRKELNKIGNYRNRLYWYGRGSGNDATVQVEFWGFERFIAFDGLMEIRV